MHLHEQIHLEIESYNPATRIVTGKVLRLETKDASPADWKTTDLATPIAFEVDLKAEPLVCTSEPTNLLGWKAWVAGIVAKRLAAVGPSIVGERVAWIRESHVERVQVADEVSRQVHEQHAQIAELLNERIEQIGKLEKNYAEAGTIIRKAREALGVPAGTYCDDLVPAIRELRGPDLSRLRAALNEIPTLTPQQVVDAAAEVLVERRARVAQLEDERDTAQSFLTSWRRWVQDILHKMVPDDDRAREEITRGWAQALREHDAAVAKPPGSREVKLEPGLTAAMPEQVIGAISTPVVDKLAESDISKADLVRLLRKAQAERDELHAENMKLDSALTLANIRGPAAPPHRPGFDWLATVSAARQSRVPPFVSMDRAAALWDILAKIEHTGPWGGEHAERYHQQVTQLAQQRRLYLDESGSGRDLVTIGDSGHGPIGRMTRLEQDIAAAASRVYDADPAR